MNDIINKFFELYFNGLVVPGHELYFKPHLHMVSDEKSNQDYIVFRVHQITDFINDEWEIKEDSFWLLWQGNIYYLFSVSTNYEENVVSPRYTTPCVIFSNDQPDEIIVKYALEKDGMENDKTRTILQKDWTKMELSLEVKKIPNGPEPEVFRKALVGHKFPLKLSDFRKHSPHKTKDGIYKIPKNDVVLALEATGKNHVAEFWRNHEDYVSFQLGCFKLY